MRTAFLSSLTSLLIWMAMMHQGHAQAAKPPAPVTRILAIGTLNPGVDLAAVRAILPTEVKETVKLYLDGKIGSGANA
ncbi:MAG: hypothetical protein JO110_05075 [Acetobacteraceae bacterium]|nr:hypothetical protein [Acetobacteraceae bacterium]